MKLLFLKFKNKNILQERTNFSLTSETNSIKVVKQGGSHRTRINNLPEVQKKQVINTLKEWLEQ